MAGATTTPSLHTPFPGGNGPSLSPQHKRGLLWAVNVSVDKIVSHFSVARNIVQKAQLGDSRTNPSVGQLVLGDLCPALEAVLRDGLKPYQQDLIVGRRPNSPWSVVEASVKAGPCPRTLYSLYSQLDQLSQLSNPQKKFNAFIFGLLNLKHLDSWVSGLHGCPEILRTHYAPTAFLSLSHGSCLTLFEELLLLLQPLSVLAFQLDPLFEYHHQFLAEQQGGGGSEPELRGPGPQARPSGTQRGRPGAGAGGEEEPGKAPAEEQVNTREGASVKRRPSAPQRPGGKESPGYTLQQTFDQVVQWGDRLAQTLVELKKPPAQPRQEQRPSAPTASPPEPGVKRKLSWWDHLGQSSQIYLSPAQDGSVFAKWMKPKASAWKAHSLFELSERQSSAPKQATATGPVAQDCGGQLSNSGPAPRSSDGGGSGAAQKDSAHVAKDGRRDPAPRGGDPSEEPEGASPPATGPGRGPASFPSDLDRKPLFRAGDRLWLGRLFGAKVPGTYSPGDPPPQEAKAPRGRLPSDWLQVSINPFDQLLKAPPAGGDRTLRPLEINPPAQEPTKPARMVRALCDHMATEEDHLSFRRGETLEILACVDEDWIRCSHGNASGLVPIGYTSLI